MNQVILTVAGTKYGAWKSVTVTRSIESISATFELEVAERLATETIRRAIAAGDPCTVSLLNGTTSEVVVTGYVDDVNVSHTGSSHTISIQGRDKTGDLVDCAAVAPGMAYKQMTFAKLASALCKPFGIPVTDLVQPSKVFQHFELNSGETVFEALDQAARQVGVLLVSDGKGGLLITRAGTGKINTPLVLGQNIRSAGVRLSQKERFSSYTVTSQIPGLAAFSQAKAADPGVTRYRPTIFAAETAADNAQCQERVNWESRVRFGRSLRMDLTVQGWAHADGLWSPNLRVSVQDDVLAVDGELLISSVRFRQDAQGTETDMTLMPPEAFERIAIPTTVPF